MLQSLYNLADDNVEHLIRDRLSFMRFLGLGLQDQVPDAETVWLYREALVKAGLIVGLFTDFDRHLKQNGYLAMGGQIIDADDRSGAEEPEQPGRERSDQVRRDAESAGNAIRPQTATEGSRCALDQEAWPARTTAGKNHISIDRRHEFVRRYTVTNAARHDSQEFDAVLDEANTCRDVWADSAYRSAETEEKLADRHFRSARAGEFAT